MQFEKHERQRLQLLHVKCAQGLSVSQDDQGGEKKEAVKSPKSASHEAEESRKQREAPVHRPKQVVAEKRIKDIQERDAVACQSQPKYHLVRQDVVRRSRGVAIDNKPAANGLGESCC